MVTKKKNECPKCGKVYILPASLKTHLLSHVNDDKFTCSECLMTFTTAALLEEHIPVHSKAFNYNAINHADDVVPTKTVTIKTKSYTCSRKAIDLSQKRGVDSNLKELVKIYQKLLRCPSCPLTFITESDLENHLSSHSYKFCTGLSAHGLSKVSAEGSFVVNHNSDNPVSSGIVPDGNDNAKVSVSNDTIRSCDESVQYCKNEGNHESSTNGNNFEISNITSQINSCTRPFNEKNFDCDQNSASPNDADSQSTLCGPDFQDTVNTSTSKDEHKTFDKNIPSALNISPLLEYSSKVVGNVVNDIEALPDNESCGMEFRQEPSTQDSLDSNISYEESEESERFSNIIESYSSLLSSFPSLIEDNLTLDSHGSLCTVETDMSSDYCSLFKCLMCPMIFLSKEEVNSHLYVHKEEFRIGSKNQKDPLEIDESIVNPGDDSFVVDRGDNSITVKSVESIFKVYLERVYAKFYKCMKCPLVFLAKEEIQNHTNNHSQENEVGYKSVPLGMSENTLDVRKPEVGSNQIVPFSGNHSSIVYCPIFQCLECEITFMSKAALETHNCLQLKVTTEGLSVIGTDSRCMGMDSSTCDMSLLACCECGKKFKDRRKFFDHKRMHSIKRFQCKMCGKAFRAKSHLKQHIKVHKHVKGNKTFKSKYVLGLHEKRHSDTTPYECSECGNVFRNKISFKLHSYEHWTSAPFNCRICKESFESLQSLIVHVESHMEELYKGDDFLPSSMHNETYSYGKEFQQYLLTHSKKRTFKCRYCSQLFKDKYHLLKHHRIHRIDGHPYQCYICQRQFSIKSSLKNHLDTHIRDKYLCHICGIKFSQRSSFYTHVKKHAGVTPHRCSICEKIFFHKGSLKRHVSMHYGRKPYHCELCGKNFKQKPHLDAHMITHTGDKSHQCKICSKSFTQKSSLKVHLMTHGTRQYSCSECGRTFTQKGTLLNHLKKDLRENSYWCKVCQKMFTRRTCLLHHKRNHRLQGTCVIEFDGNREIIETYIDSSVDEHKEIIITQPNACESGEEVIETQTVVIEDDIEQENLDDFCKSDTAVVDSQETQFFSLECDGQTLEFGSMMSQEFDLSSHITQAFDFGSPSNMMLNFDIQENSFENESQVCITNSNVSQTFETHLEESNSIAFNTTKCLSLEPSGSQGLTFNMKGGQVFTIEANESNSFNETQHVSYTIPGSDSFQEPLPSNEREEIVVTQEDKKEAGSETMQIHFVF